MRYKYLTIDTSTKEGLKRAEKIKAEGEQLTPDGYHMETVGVNKVQFSIPVRRTV
jgi:hypothetical protein